MSPLHPVCVVFIPFNYDHDVITQNSVSSLIKGDNFVLMEGGATEITRGKGRETDEGKSGGRR